jgi:hypothetical protein
MNAKEKEVLKLVKLDADRIASYINQAAEHVISANIVDEHSYDASKLASLIVNAALKDREFCLGNISITEVEKRTVELILKNI